MSRIQILKIKDHMLMGKILSAVRPEPVGVEEHNKCIDKKTQLILKAVAVFIVIYSAASLLFRSYAVVSWIQLYRQHYL